MLTSGVYAILNLFNDKLYIGSAKNIRGRLSWHYLALEGGRHHNVLLQRAWAKYGEETFIFFVVERTGDLLEREQYWIDRFIADLYNVYLVAGSPAKAKLTAEHKAKISASLKGKSQSKEAKANMSKAQLNRNPEWRANHSAAMKKRIFSETHRARLTEANFKRKPVSEETRRRMAEGQKRRIERQGYVVKPK